MLLIPPSLRGAIPRSRRMFSQRGDCITIACMRHSRSRALPFHSISLLNSQFLFTISTTRPPFRALPPFCPTAQLKRHGEKNTPKCFLPWSFNRREDVWGHMTLLLQRTKIGNWSITSQIPISGLVLSRNSLSDLFCLAPVELVMDKKHKSSCQTWTRMCSDWTKTQDKNDSNKLVTLGEADYLVQSEHQTGNCNGQK
jgi:L-rhamnose mutarotase